MAMRMTTTTGGKPPGKPSFFWQGLLILLPVVALASVGLYALRQDKALARLAAAEHAQALADLIADSIWNALTALPGPGESDPNSFQVDRAGHLVFPRPYAITPAPQPFSQAALSPEQTRLWLAAIGGDSVETEDRAATVATWKQLLDLSPPADVAASARFRLGLVLAKQQEVAAATEQFGIAIEQHPLATGESGLPLRPLAQMKLLELAAADPARSRSEKMALLDLVCSNAVACGGRERPTERGGVSLDQRCGPSRHG